MVRPEPLRTRFDPFAWYDAIRARGAPVVWCSAFAPAEALIACGLQPVYPENHAAILGALSPARDPDAPYARAAIARAEDAGLEMPRLCSYALADVGVLLGEDSPLGSLPAPDAFYACDSQCAVVARWGEAVAHHVDRDLPHFVLHAPPLTRAEAHSPEELDRFEADLVGHCEAFAARFGTAFDRDRLAAVVAESDRANRLWQRCLELTKRRPAPWTMTEAFQAMAPIVVARGGPECTAFYRELLAELEDRVARGVAAIPAERVRLCWDAIPIWPRKNWLASFCAERGAVFATSTYTHSWWFRFDPARPLRSLVERYAWNTMNRSGRWVLDWTRELVRDYACDGIVAHWNRSCGIWNSYVKRRRRGYAEAGIPALEIEADMVDARAFDEARIGAALERFIDEVAGRSACVP